MLNDNQRQSLEQHAVDMDAMGYPDGAKMLRQLMEPIPMVLHCPECHEQHVDKAEAFTPTGRCECAGPDECEVCESNRAAFEESWQNPPHRSHLCAKCGCIWRPADVPTVGVERITTRGKADSWWAGKCGICDGTGRTVRDPDIGTDQECCGCNGTGTES